MPSLFSRKKSNARNNTRPASGIPDSTGIRGTGVDPLRRTDSPEAMPAMRPGQPPASQLPQASHFAQKELPYAPSQTPQDRQPGAQAPRNGMQSTSLPDARQRQPQAGRSESYDTQRPSSSDAEPRPNSSRSSGSSFWSKRVLRGEQAFPRRGYSAALHAQVLYWFGGKSDRALNNDLDMMDTATWEVRRVQAVGSVPEPREGHTATFIGRTMFVFGGELESRVCDNSLYAYYMANCTWYKVPMQGEPLEGRKGHTTVQVGSKMYVFGGTNGKQYLNDLVSFDVHAAATQGPRWNFDNLGTANIPGNRNSQASVRRENHVLPPARAGHSSSIYPGSIYVFGGMNGEQCFNDLWVYDFELRRWSEVKPYGATPPARYGHASAVVDDCIFIMGGRTLHGEPLHDFFAYKITSQRWYTFQVNSAAWPHQIDPVFSLVKTRLLLYSGSMPRDSDGAGQVVYSLDTSKIKIQPDAPRANQAAMPPPPPASPQQQQQQQQMADETRRHHSLMPPPLRDSNGQKPLAPPGGRAVSMAVQEGARPGLAVDTARNGSASLESFEIVSPQGNEDESRAWSPQGKAKAHQRRSIALVNSAGSPPVGPAPPAPPPAPGAAAEAAGSAGDLPGGNPDDERLTIQLRNRGAGGMAQDTQQSPRDAPRAAEAPRDVWAALAAKYDAGGAGAGADDEPRRILDVVLGMRRELGEAKQQLSTVSRRAMERVAEAERGRAAALQEAIYLKAKASALASGSPQLLSKLGAHRIRELERLHANTLNDNDALRSQLAAANQALKQSHDALAEYRSDAELTRKQLCDLEARHSEMQEQQEQEQQQQQGDGPSEAAAELEQRVAQLEQQLREKDAALESLSDADAERSARLDSALQSAESANQRAERVQQMLEESLQRSEELDAQVAELAGAVERQKAEAQRAADRAAKYEQMWADAKQEVAAFAQLRAAVEQLETKDRHIASLQRKLSDVQPLQQARKDSNSSLPRPSLSSDTPSDQARIREFHSAYLTAQRQWSETRDELLSLKAVLREADDQRRESDARLAQRERELSEVNARLSAFTSLLQEYADSARTSKIKGLDRADDGISVASMLAAIQQLQRSSSFAADPAPSPQLQQPLEAAAPRGPTHIL
ncbi:hypothetical protein LPJ79_003757 [Coemansia sp. RSA 1821]|nr:hypothetical protein LPJ68_003262 [Coemansia sp. RSA 1086]KAJ1749371.1 hypothetical protein LPJ79_003757 [Coemansia sp. RSA 1821]